MSQDKNKNTYLLQALTAGRSLFSSEFKSNYREAFLGVLWTILPTLFMVLSYMIAESSQIVSTNSQGVPIFLFLMTGLLTWQSFAESLMAPLQSLRKSKRFFLKINLPIETFLVSKAFDILLFAVLRHVILLIILYSTFEISGIAPILISFMLLFLLLFFGFSLGILLSPFGILIQDFGNIISYIVNFFLLCTPVLYRKVDTGLLSVVNQWNPLTIPFEGLRNSLIFPNDFRWNGLHWFLMSAFIIFILGYKFLKAAKAQIYEKAGM